MQFLNSVLKLVDQYNSTCHHSALTEKINTNSKAPKFKVNARVRNTKHKNIFGKDYSENCSR